MAEQLSQGQIDALLKRLSSGEVDAVPEEQSGGRRIKDYDFKSPKKFTKEQLKAMDSLHENFSRLLSNYLSGLLRLYCEVSVLQIEEQRYFEYNNALPDGSLLALVDLKPKNRQLSEATLIMDVNTTVGFLMIDRLLGGSGDGYNINREFSDIELAILENVIQKIVRLMEEAWCSHLEVTAEMSSIETNSRLLQALSPEDIVVIVVLNCKIKNLSAEISICIPAVNLEEMIGSFTSKYARVNKRQSVDIADAARQRILSALTDSDLEVKAVLGRMQLDLKDVLQLQVADVIPLSKSINSDIEVLVDNTPWFSGKLGETKLKKAIKISNLKS